MSLWRQTWLIARHGIASEFANRERLVSPILFGATILLLFSFAFGELDRSLKTQFFIAQTFFAVFLSLQLAFSRAFEPVTQDSVFDLMRTYPISYTAWFIALYFVVFLMGILICTPTLLFSALLQYSQGSDLLTSGLGIIALAVLIGLTAIGVLLSALTLKAGARQMLHPLLYFPLSTPVLLSSIQAGHAYANDGFGDGFWAWVSLLGCFDVIYLTLSILLFSELIDES